MEPKDSIQLGAGTIYVGRSEGLHHLGNIDELYEVEDERWADEPWPKKNPYIVKTADSATFEARMAFGNDFFARFKAQHDLVTKFDLSPLAEMVLQTLDNFAKYMKSHPRVVHLAKHGKNRRIRKKNAKRILRGD